MRRRRTGPKVTVISVCSCTQVKFGVQVNQKVLVVKKIGEKKNEFQLSATADKPKLRQL